MGNRLISVEGDLFFFHFATGLKLFEVCIFMYFLDVIACQFLSFLDFVTLLFFLVALFVFLLLLF